MDRLNQILENSSSLIVFALDKEYKYLYFNKSHANTMRHIWGVDIEIGHSMMDYIGNSEDREKASANFSRALRGESFTLIEEYGDKKIDRRYFEDIYSPLFDENNEIVGLSVIVNEVTKRREKEVSIFESENRFRAIIEGAFEGISVARTRDMQVVYVNPAAMKMFGYSEEEFLNLRVNDLHREEDFEFVQKEFQAQLSKERMTVYTIPCKRKDNTIFYCDVSSVPVMLDGEECLVGYFTDITENIQAQNVLKESESRIKNISNSLPGAVLQYKLNSDGTDELLYLSQGAESLWEVPYSEALNDASKLWEKVFSEDIQQMQESMVKSAHDLSYWDHEWRIQMEDGRIKWLNGRGIPSRQDDGSTIWDSLILDITEQKETLVKLDESQKLLDSINQNINEGIYRSDENGVIYVNNAFIKMFGFSSLEEMQSLKQTDIYKNPLERKALVKKISKYGFFENEEVQFVRKDGSVFIGLISSRLFRDNEGKRYWDGAIRDVTAERQNARKILESQQLLESINKNINEAIYRSINRKGLIYVNEEFVKMFGYDSVEELTSGNPVDLYKNPEDRRILGDELVNKGSYVNREVEFKRKDGTIFWGSISSIMIDADDGEIYFDGAIRDITNQKLAENELKTQVEMQYLLRKISSEYINVPLDKVDEVINKSLEELGQFANADRAYVFDFFVNEKYCVNTYEWCAPDIASYINELQYVPLDEIPAVYDTYVKGRP